MPWSQRVGVDAQSVFEQPPSSMPFASGSYQPPCGSNVTPLLILLDNLATAWTEPIGLYTFTRSPSLSHSTFNESPLVRELGKYAIGGKASTDTDIFADVLPDFADINPPYNTKLTLKRLTPVGQAGCGYEALWMNPSDAYEKGIKDGDLVKVYNPIGSVHAVGTISYMSAKVKEWFVVIIFK